MTYLFLVIAAVIVFIAIYWLVHHKMGYTWLGRIAATVIPGAGILFDQFGQLPWDKFLDAGKAAAVMAGLLIGHCAVQAYNLIAAQMNSSAPPAPPAA